jgi:2-aminoethylphosphonate-pyruvate transaminase
MATSETGDPLLLTPGPLTTSRSVKEVMVHDWGSRDAGFIAINRAVLARLPELIRGEDDFVTVPMQGSGTFAVEAMLTTFVPLEGEVLVLINGAYGQRAKRILDIARRARVVHETPEDTPPDLAAVEAILAQSRSITHVFAVQCETTSGILNPIEGIAEIAERHGKRLLIDAMSAFGALPLDARDVTFDAVAASSNKCIEGVPGLGFVLCRKSALARPRAMRRRWCSISSTSTGRSSRPASTGSRRPST